ncbi:MAG: peptide chain release factor N(5)-glutamine methyltransferase [Pirellulales bacterium]|nr:peptide chain release factor N(5)-glutamine methyltransferase [Pirellulales bacterium]
MSEETWTIGRLLTWTSEYLASHGSDSPRLDAEVLLAHVRGCERIDLYTAFEELADESVKSAFRAMVKRRAEGTPVAYLVGQREFFSLPFRVTPDVLIPRPETEFVVLAMLDWAEKFSDTPSLRIADIGTGSGVLAVCAAHQLQHATVLAIDQSPSALAIAQENATTLGVAERICFLESDLFAQLESDRQFEIIVSNPPYIKTSEADALPRDVREHEPVAALFSGETGTEIIERLIHEAESRLMPGGGLICEISPQLKPRIEQVFADKPAWRNLRFRKDLAGLDRAFEVERADG